MGAVSKSCLKSKKLKLEFCQNNLDRFLNQDTGPLFE